jgi:hypothetical protein
MKIEFYLHQIWLALICILLLVSLFSPIALFVVEEGQIIELTNFRLIYEDGSTRGALWGLGVILILIFLVGTFELLLSGFRNFVLQKRLLIFMMLLTLGYYILLVIGVLLLKGSASFVPKVDTWFYSWFYTNNMLRESVDFGASFRRAFSRQMMISYPSYASYGFDTSYYFLKGISLYGDEFENNLHAIQTNPVQMGFKFERVNNWGGFINRKVFFIHLSNQYKVEKIDFDQ